MFRFVLTAVACGWMVLGFGIADSTSAALQDAAGRLIETPYGPSSPPAPAGVGLDFPELPGWPRTMGVDVNYAPGGGPATVDVDGDGAVEVFAGSTDRKLYAWRIDGTLFTGFPKTLSGMLQTSPAVGDVDGDGVADLLAATTNGWAYAYHMDGSALTGWPKHPGGTVSQNSFVLHDMDGDGSFEAILASGNNLYIWRGDGSDYPGFPVSFLSAYGAVATPAIGDLDHDGHPEIVVEGWEWLNVFHEDGTVVSGWPYHLPLSYEGFSYSAPALVDFDGDGQREIVAAYHESGGGNWSGKVCVWRYNGVVASGWPYVMADFGSWCFSTAAVGDLDEDGAPEFAMTSHNGNLYLFNFDGGQVPGFPVMTGYYNAEASCAIADLDDDGHLEVCFGSNNNPGGFAAYERDGTPVAGFPLAMSGAMMVSGSCILDADSNGRVNICAHDRTGNVYLWDLPGTFHEDRVPWGRPHHDDQHTGLYGGLSPAAAPEPMGAGHGWAMSPLWPNPSMGRASFTLAAPRPGDARVVLVDAAGRIVTALFDGRTVGGEKRFDIDLNRPRHPGGMLPPGGTYFVRVFLSDRILSRPVVILR